ncbi:elongation factor 4 [Candidatus Peregrinibacteria bacterium]|nr:elongation factor 4 [Candidatus Peregrinibacteria bacterium]
MSDISLIRNFCIIAHIDHGKSTLADRLLEQTGTIDKRDMKHAQMLDTMELEQERGITIKLQPVRMNWNGYILNLIDTPGHVDFSYEVSRSIAACEGAILVVDATQGIEAQTLANLYLALEHNFAIIPVLNKIDLPNADVERRANEIEAVFGIPKEEIVSISAKNGTNVDMLLQRIVDKFPPPRGIFDKETKALIFDSVYDSYKGVVAYVRLMQGSVARGDRVTFLSVQRTIEVLEVGYFKPQYLPTERLYPGEVGYIVTGLKEVSEARVGDTVWRPDPEMKIDPMKAIPLPGYRQVKPFVFASIFCVDGDNYPLLRDALNKLRLNDAALSFEPETAGALGHGFRCGFLGLLHMEIVQERLEREYDLSLVITAPSVSYQVVLTGETEVLTLSNPSLLPDRTKIEKTLEPWVKVEVLTPKEYVGGVMQLVQEKRGISKNMQYLDEMRVILAFELPLASIVLDFYDRLKTISSGYASMNYEFLNYRASDLVKMDILIAGELVDSLSIIIHRDEAYRAGSSITKKLKELIPKTMFEIAIQAAIGSKIIARESISAMRKDVTAKLYGGDRTRKDKLLKKQKAGKKRMKMVGRVELPQEVFLAVLQR